MIFSDLRNRDSELVQNVERWGSWTHLIRADELPYTSAEKKGRKK